MRGVETKYWDLRAAMHLQGQPIEPFGAARTMAELGSMEWLATYKDTIRQGTGHVGSGVHGSCTRLNKAYYGQSVVAKVRHGLLNTHVHEL